jgi:hypothetical protein
VSVEGRDDVQDRDPAVERLERVFEGVVGQRRAIEGNQNV